MATSIITVIFACCCLISATHALIPRVCAKNFTVYPSYCCPIPPGYKTPCGYPTRGICAPVQLYVPLLRVKYRYFMTTDIRFLWPKRLYSYTCTCNSVYWGPDCGECRFGYGGKDCTKRVMKVRRNLLSLNAKERQQLLDVFVKIRTLKSEYVVPKLHEQEIQWTGEFMDVDPYEFVNFCHIVGTYPQATNNGTRCSILDNNNWDYGHVGITFPMYHRYLLLMYERMLSRVASQHFGIDDFALPYWDWTNLRKCDICTNDLVGESTKEYDSLLNANFLSKKSPFGDPKKWPVFCSSKNGNTNVCHICVFNRTNPLRASRGFTSFEMPTMDEIIEILKLSRYDNTKNFCASFERNMESGYNCVCAWKSKPFILHVKLHRYMIGTFKPLASTAFDPMFLYHHLQIDRYYERWLRRIKPGTKELRHWGLSVNHCGSCNLASFFPSVNTRDLFTDSRRWGYTFDNLDFGPLSDKVQVANRNRIYKKKTCPLKQVLSL